MPKDVAFDGGFASEANLKFAKDEGVKNITFSKSGKMQIEDMVESKRKHRGLKKFRAGIARQKIARCISFFKRILGGTKVLDRTKATFKSVIHKSVLNWRAVAYNLTLLARHRLERNLAT